MNFEQNPMHRREKKISYVNENDKGFNLRINPNIQKGMLSKTNTNKEYSHA
jgi:hypothetical protein